ncbi:hypothetical protein PMAYCL1PPCAC_07997, partial [Pristionchus mayeri]
LPSSSFRRSSRCCRFHRWRNIERSKGNKAEILSLPPSAYSTQSEQASQSKLASNPSSGSIHSILHLPTVHVTVATTCYPNVSIAKGNSACFFSRCESKESEKGEEWEHLNMESSCSSMLL